LPVNIEWRKDESRGEGVYIMAHPEEKLKTARAFNHQVLVPAEFLKEGQRGQALPAQIEKWEEVKNVGKFSKHVWTGMLSSAEKSEILDRIDTLIQAVKKARQRANTADVEKVKIGTAFLNFINNK